MSKLRILAAAVVALAVTSAQARPVQPPRHVLVFGDSNSWGWTPELNAFPTTRLAVGKRWPDVMAKALGPSVVVSVDALSGRTVDVDYSEAVGTVRGEQFNGLRALPAAIAREMPLDLVVLMLGTNDVRSDLNRSPAEVASGIARLVAAVRSSTGGVLTNYPAPRVLVVVPPRVEDTSRTPIGGVMLGAQEKSRALARAVRTALAGSGVPVVDAGSLLTVHGIDGVHMTASDHNALGVAMANEVRRTLAASPSAKRR
jgi:lysophospholipase L1-like esterase